MPRQPFNILRAAFWLLAIIMVLQVLASIAVGIGCWWINYTGPRQPMACQEVGELVRQLWSELITTVLALLLAGRSGPPSPPSNPSAEDDHE